MVTRIYLPPPTDCKFRRNMVFRELPGSNGRTPRRVQSSAGDLENALTLHAKLQPTTQPLDATRRPLNAAGQRKLLNYPIYLDLELCSGFSRVHRAR